MHEYAIVEGIVTSIASELNRKNIAQISGVHLRRGSTFAEAPLLQAWEMLTPGTPLAGAQLTIDEIMVEHTCTRCGAKRAIVADDLLGHTYICPDCGQAHHIDEAHSLELVEITS